MVEAYNRNRNLLYLSLKSYGFDCIKPEGAILSFCEVTLRRREGILCRLQKYRVLVVPGSSFACTGYVRISYCVSYEQIERSLPAFKKIGEECGVRPQ